MSKNTIKRSKAVILARVSTKRQQDEGLSLDNQLETLRSYANQRGLKLADREFVFSESADHKIRKRFDEFVAYVLQHKDIGVVLSYRVDRATRNYRDAVVMDDLRLNQGLELHFVNDRLVLTQDSIGRDIQDWDLKVFLAKQYLNRLKEDAVISARFKISNHQWFGKAPIGYINVAGVNGKRTIIVDDEKASLVTTMFKYYSTGKYSLRTLIDEMRRLGLTVNTSLEKTRSNGYAEHILKNPFYYGMMSFKGELHRHEYETLITKELFDKVQVILIGRSVKHTQLYATKPFALRGVVTCHNCGCAISCYEKKGKYVYCRCTKQKGTCLQKQVNETLILKQVEELFKDLTIPKEEAERIAQVLKESNKDQSNFYTRNISALQRQLITIKQRQDRLLDMHIDGRITMEIYDTKQLGLEKEKDETAQRISKLVEADKDYFVTALQIISLTTKAYSLFMSSTPEQKNRLLKMVLANCTLDDEKVRYEVQKPFAYLLPYTKRQLWLPGMDSNHDKRLQRALSYH
jgi:site-specific DNA recombinase